MKQLEATFAGIKDGVIMFVLEDQTLLRFHKVRNDLIHELDLHNPGMPGIKMMVKYFVSHQGDNDIYILSDLQLK